VTDPSFAPLAGVRVVALEHSMAMPMCTFVLAELGAEVIKIERVGRGDVVRGWDSVANGLSAGFVAANAGKRDIAVDLGTDDGVEVVRRLVATADVFVENFRPGAADRLGLSYADLSELNRTLVYCSLSGYGHSGPYRDVRAFDLLVQGESGILLTNGSPGQPAKVGLPVTDMISGSTAAIGIVSALLERTVHGRGRHLDVAMLDSAVSWLAYYPHHFWHAGESPPLRGMRHQYLSPYGPFLAADGAWVNIAVGDDTQWRRLCEQVIDRGEWVADPRFATVRARADRRTELDALMDAVIAARASAEWFRLLDAAGLPYGRVRDLGSAMAHPQVAARELVVTASSPVGELPLVRFPLAPADRRRAIPALGGDTREVLTELGYDPEEIEKLGQRGVVELADPG
jgi:itaconate CoA-transferase